ncbi:MAG: phosphoglucosamine mutase [Saprospiraceae bacterium]|nr:phosphoglucosamine mutase [Saprospiraceae bacterium]
MSLIKSISGIRGTIGGVQGENLTPNDIVAFTSGFAALVASRFKSPKVIVGRDGRISGPMVQSLVTATLQSMGIHVLDADLTTTPSLEMAIPAEKAQGGIMITASHNSMEWNALKFMDEHGEFINAASGQQLLDLSSSAIQYKSGEQLGGYSPLKNTIANHIKAILKLKLVNTELIKIKRFKIVVDVINSTGGLAVPALLDKLGCEYVLINEEIDGRFAHNPEPLPEHINELVVAVIKHKADLGIVVDPDVDRLAFVSDNGDPFGEEYTLVSIADYVLSKEKGNSVSNLSSTQALRDITLLHGGQYFASAVGEVNVVAKMKETNAVIGGEGNGGVIYPKLHYGRDALVGIALFLSQLAEFSKSSSLLRSKYPNYEISKNKIELAEKKHMEQIFKRLKDQYQKHKTNSEDGLRIDLDGEWVHLRQSNTEPIIRIYAESNSKVVADHLAQKLIKDIREIQKDLK